MDNKTLFLATLAEYYGIDNVRALVAWGDVFGTVNQHIGGDVAARNYAVARGLKVVKPLPPHLAALAATISAPQFNALAQLSRLREGSRAQEGARLVLVDGWSEGEAAKRVGLPYKDVWRAVENAWQTIDLCKVVVDSTH